MARAKVYPALLSSDVTPEGTRQTWAVASRVTAGTVYLVDLHADCNGVATLCQCEAAHADRSAGIDRPSGWRSSATSTITTRAATRATRRNWPSCSSWWSPDPNPSDVADWSEVAS